MTLFENQDAWADRDRAPRRRRSPVVAAVIIGAVVVASSLTALGIAFGPGLLASATLSGEAAALADRIGFTATGRDLFAWAHPELLGDEAFLSACAGARAWAAVPRGIDDETIPKGGDEPDDEGDEGETGMVGCFVPGYDDGGRIAVFRPEDPRLADQVVVTTVHEFLHAAYDRLGGAERAALDPLLEARWREIPADDPIQAAFEGSTGGHNDARSTEQFAYLGSEVADLGPELEAFYTPYFTDRQTAVAFHTADRALWDGLLAAHQTVADALTAAEQAVADADARLQAERGQLEADRAAYAEAEAEYYSYGPSERGSLYTVLDDGGFGEPYGDYLAGVRAALDGREAGLPALQTELEALQQAATERRAEFDLSAGELEALDRAAFPRAEAFARSD